MERLPRGSLSLLGTMFQIVSQKTGLYSPAMSGGTRRSNCEDDHKENTDTHDRKQVFHRFANHGFFDIDFHSESSRRRPRLGLGALE